MRYYIGNPAGAVQPEPRATPWDMEMEDTRRTANMIFDGALMGLQA
jgi:hypothetical protein